MNELLSKELEQQKREIADMTKMMANVNMFIKEGRLRPAVNVMSRFIEEQKEIAIENILRLEEMLHEN